ncbi:MAG TPA: DUF664 domain-containing protein [Actinomycetes bacterium]|nr:DUF664 domain-containing protein [Actinomycetes bacterium]
MLSLYKKAVDESRAIMRAAELDQLSAVNTERRGHISMRWILLHMIEEVSRHLGHADTMRESIDGTVGDYPGGHPSRRTMTLSRSVAGWTRTSDQRIRRCATSQSAVRTRW